MILLFFVLFLVIGVVFLVAYDASDYADWALPSGIISIVLAIIFGTGSGILWYQVNTAHTIDEKLEIYSKEQAVIEKSIVYIVKSQDEEGIAQGLEEKDPITLIALFPELESDPLVARQVDTYIHNNNAILKLSQEKIDVSKSRWLLYFGK